MLLCAENRRFVYDINWRGNSWRLPWCRFIKQKYWRNIIYTQWDDGV